ncbi:MAG TPA: M48 family metalloprotease, partial [Euzebyales bacterium]|nr:M48 family metalloprotease [Euzebyales bacterium]
FYVLAIVVAVALILAPVLEIMFADRIHFQLLFLALVGIAILWSLVPRRREKWVDPGPRFTAETQPELTQLVRRVAGEVGQPMPDELYLLDDLNAFVTTRGGFLSMGGRRVLAVGVPLMMVLDGEELASVMAHEFGHFHGGDTRLLPLVYRTRGTMQRTLSAATGWVQGIFKAYASFYLARSQGISRAQEIAADRLAARVTNPHATASALARLPVASAAFEYYRSNEYAPVLAAGRQPAYFSGFQGTLESATASRDGAGLSVDVALGDHTHSRFDSHPSPLDRIKALGVDPESVLRGRPPTTAATLLREPEAVQAALVARHTGSFPTDRTPVRWEDVGMEVLLAGWRSAVDKQLLPAAPHLAPGAVPVDGDDLAELGSAVFQHAGVTATRPERENAARMLCGQYLAVAAADAGWTVESLPGQPVRFVRGGNEWDLFNDYTQVCAGALDLQTWRSRLEAAGIAGLPSGTPHARPSSGGAFHHEPAPQPAAAHDAALAASPSPAMTATEARPATLQYRGKPGLRRELVIDGTRLQWGDQVVDAGEVTAIGYRVVNNQWDAQFAIPSGELRFKVNTGKKASEAWAAVMRWSELYIQPRLVDDLLVQFQRTGRVEIDGVTFTAEGFTARKGSLLRWEEFAGTSFTGAQTALHRRADNLDGHQRVAVVRTHIKHGGALVPALCQALMASRG